MVGLRVRAGVKGERASPAASPPLTPARLAKGRKGGAGRLDIGGGRHDAGRPPPELRCPSSCRFPTSIRSSSRSACSGSSWRCAGTRSPISPGCSSAGATSAALCRRPALWGGTPAMRPEQADDLLTWMIVGRHPRRAARLRAVLPAGLLRGEPGRDPRGLAWRHVVPRRPPRGGRGRRRLQPEERARDPEGRRRGGGGGADRALLRAGRELHQRRALGPAVDRALGGGLSRRGGADLPGRLGRALRPASLAALRGGARGARALRRPRARDPRRRAGAAGAGVRDCS